MVGRLSTGVLALVGGDEFHPGNEVADSLLVDAADRLGADRPAFLVGTAAVRQHPEDAVATASRWFAALGLPVVELRVRTRREAQSAGTVERAATGRFFYLCGGDPGIVPRTLAGTAAWQVIVAAWRTGAVLAGSSAGAMALGEWTLIRARMPGDARREPRPGLALVPGLAIAPHWNTFGHRWLPSARAALPDATILGLDERTAAVLMDDEWRVRGPGEATVVRPTGNVRRFADGERIRGLPQPSATSP